MQNKYLEVTPVSIHILTKSKQMTKVSIYHPRMSQKYYLSLINSPIKIVQVGMVYRTEL